MIRTKIGNNGLAVVSYPYKNEVGKQTMSEEKKQLNFWCWVGGNIICALGLALTTKSGLGMSMIGSLPFIIHKYMIQIFPWYSQGTSEYILQAMVIIITGLIVRKFKVKWLLSFMTAIVAGLCIDGWLFVLGGNGIVESILLRVALFISGTLLTAFAIALFFRTRMPLQAYELAVVEIAERYNFDKSKVKYVNDITYLIIDVMLSLILMHRLVGVGLGTIIITVINAPLIAFFTKILDKIGVPN